MRMEKGERERERVRERERIERGRGGRKKERGERENRNIGSSSRHGASDQSGTCVRCEDEQACDSPKGARRESNGHVVINVPACA
jgi:hypothetical protein